MFTLRRQSDRIIRYSFYSVKQSRLFTSGVQLSNMSRISDTIKSDHREIEKWYDHIINAKDDDERTRYQNQFTWELARHSHGEELVVYPAFEKNVTNGKAMADKDREEHQVVCRVYSFHCYNLPDEC